VKHCPGPAHEGPNPLPLSAFSPDGRKRSGVRAWCRECSSAASRRWREANPEKYQKQNHEGQRCLTAAASAAVFAHYGHACACCGSTERLTIDHINGDGKRHREEIRANNGPSFHRWLIKNNFPSGFQTLCLLCNRSKGDGPACRIDHSLPIAEALLEARRASRREWKQRHREADRVSIVPQNPGQ